MLVGCDWWFSIRIFFVAGKPLPMTRTCTVVNFHNLHSLLGPGGGGGVLPYMGYIGMCSPQGYGFSAILVINRVSNLVDSGHK